MTVLQNIRRRLYNALRSWSSSVDESQTMLAHFGGILDHAVKVITTVGLIVALTVISKKNSSWLPDVMLIALGLLFFIYLLRLFEHIVIFFVDKYDLFPTGSPRFRLTVGVLVLLFNVCISLTGWNMIEELVKMDFLQ